jgi:hypothetical protein
VLKTPFTQLNEQSPQKDSKISPASLFGVELSEHDLYTLVDATYRGCSVEDLEYLLELGGDSVGILLNRVMEDYDWVLNKYIRHKEFFDKLIGTPKWFPAKKVRDLLDSLEGSSHESNLLLCRSLWERRSRALMGKEGKGLLVVLRIADSSLLADAYKKVYKGKADSLRTPLINDFCLAAVRLNNLELLSTLVHQMNISPLDVLRSQLEKARSNPAYTNGQSIEELLRIIVESFPGSITSYEDQDGLFKSLFRHYWRDPSSLKGLDNAWPDQDRFFGMVQKQGF